MSVVDQSDEQEVVDAENVNSTIDGETTCKTCRAEFLDPDDLNIHIEQIHRNSDPNAKRCQFCTVVYTDLLDYAKHIRDSHLRHIKCCQYCMRVFTDYDQHRIHEKKHNKGNKSAIKCTQCGSRFGNVYDLKNHDLETHKNETDGVNLYELFPYLSAVLNTKSTTLLLSLNTDSDYVCLACDFFSSDINYFIKHVKNSKCATYVCDRCYKVYKTKYNLNRHLSKSKKCYIKYGKGKTVKCNDCHLVLDKHLFAKHKKNCKVIKCYACGVIFKSMYDLSEHQSTEHPLALELKTCMFCWKQCVGSVALDKHITRSHKGKFHLYKYRCIDCKSVYKHPQNLFGHFFTKHKDLDPYTCKICDKTFHLRKKFTLHIKLTHQCVGFVEFDENYHVFFTDKKSENPFVPKSIYGPENTEKSNSNLDSTADSNVTLLNSEMSVTETEGNQTEAEVAPKPKLKRKSLKRSVKKKVVEPVSTIESSDDEPLLVIKNKLLKAKPKVIQTQARQGIKNELTSINKKQFTCYICKKYCYTYQNYNHHISLHSKKEYKKCIKCTKVFKSKDKLNNHISTEHSTSRLTETLRNLLEKRKKGQTITDDLPMSERFRRTIKKVDTDNWEALATITPIDKGLSVKNYIENFTPEPEKTIPIIDHTVTVNVITDSSKKPTINMTKFEPKPLSTSTRLSMPVKFKDCYLGKATAVMRLVQTATICDDDSQDNSDYGNDNEDNHEDRASIPEVAEEIMLEGTEDPPKVQIPHKIVIPKLDIEFKDIRIAHLLSEAPYYKIVKVNEVLQMQNQQNSAPQAKPMKNTPLKLPDGTKLVNTNPLAHLLGKKSVEKVLEPIRNKYYKPKVKNFQGMLAEALSNLDKPHVKKKKKAAEVAKAVGN